MSKANLDEKNFIEANREDNVSFKSFEDDSETKNLARLSNFSLIKQIVSKASKEDEVTNVDIRDASSVQELIHIKSGDNSKKTISEKASFDISDKAMSPLRYGYSIRSFLEKNTNEETSGYENNKNGENFHYKDFYNEKYVDNGHERIISRNKNESETDSGNKHKYAAIFKNSNGSEAVFNKPESLHEIYKRLLKCQ